VSNQREFATAEAGLDVPEFNVLIADSTLFKSVLNAGKP
jgi:hypothetical protein